MRPFEDFLLHMSRWCLFFSIINNHDTALHTKTMDVQGDAWDDQLTEGVDNDAVGPPGPALPLEMLSENLSEVDQSEGSIAPSTSDSAFLQSSPRRPRVTVETTQKPRRCTLLLVAPLKPCKRAPHGTFCR